MLRCCRRTLGVAFLVTLGSQASAGETINGVCKVEFDGKPVIDGGCYLAFTDEFTFLFNHATNVNRAIKFDQFIRLAHGVTSDHVTYNGGGGREQRVIDLGDFADKGTNADGLSCYKGQRGEVCFGEK